jgi:hypothetical protein
MRSPCTRPLFNFDNSDTALDHCNNIGTVSLLSALLRLYAKCVVSLSFLAFIYDLQLSQLPLNFFFD